MAAILTWVGVLIVLVTSAGLLLNREWRMDLGLLALQYGGAAILIAQHLPLGMAAAKLVTGWMATAALGMTLSALPPPVLASEPFWPRGRTFRLFMVGMMGVLTISVTPRMETAIPGLGMPVIAGGILLIGIGFLQLGTNSDIVRVIYALLTIITGFEILYAGVESSILVAALLAVVTLGLGLLGAYLFNASAVDEESE